MSARVFTTEVKQQINKEGFDYHHWGETHSNVKFLENLNSYATMKIYTYMHICSIKYMILHIFSEATSTLFPSISLLPPAL